MNARQLLLLAASLTIAGAACRGGSEEKQTPAPAATATQSATSTPTASPTATPTPDALDRQPATATEAQTNLEAVLVGASQPCVPLVIERWDAVCLEGDLDGDSAADSAYLVPLAGGAGVSPAPAVVLVVRGDSERAERFPQRDDADASELGLPLFEVVDRNGDARPEIAYLSTRCGASNCASRLEVQTWDGTAWRDIGPGQPGFDNPETIAWSDSGAASVLAVHGGALGSVGAGPTRSVTSRYELQDGMYQLAEETPDDPIYLVHAIFDADALFDEGNFDASIAAYRAAIDNPSLLDWHAETGRPPGRPSLVGYALFRIAVATAAAGDDPTVAMDAVIVGSPEPLFAEGVQAFRRGFQEGDTVSRGCIEATRYFSQPAAEAIIEQRFDYGYGNPRKRALDICPL